MTSIADLINSSDFQDWLETVPESTETQEEYQAVARLRDGEA